MTDKLDPTHDQRPARDGWAPGNYFNRCLRCSAGFFGDKRAYWCADCAYAPEPDEEAEVTLTRERLLEMREKYASCNIQPGELPALIDLALCALPLPDGDGLSREKILSMWSDLESGRALPLAEDLRAVFSLALRAMPLSEGEAQALCTELRSPSSIGSSWDHDKMQKAADTIERQEERLATVERERDEQEKRANSWRHDFLRAEKECRAAEASLASAPTDDRLRKLIDSAIKAGQLDAFGTSRGLVMDLVNAVRTLSTSLASARQALQAIADRYVKAPGWAAPTPTTELVWSMYEIARTALSSPRQEGT